MSTSDGISFLRSAAHASQRVADAAAVESALDELHTHIFGSVAPADIAHQAVLRQIQDARSLFSKVETASRADLDTGRLLLDAVFTLGEMLTSAAEGRRVRSRVVQRLEDVVLPILFIRSNITPQLLKKHALKAPWAIFEAARQKPNKELEKVELAFASWNTNHGWDFLARKERCHGANKAVTPTSATTTTTVEERPPNRPASAPDQQRAVLRDISWNVALKRSAGAGIPSYLLTKRRREDCNTPCACPAPFLPGVPRFDAAPTHTLHTTIDPINDKPDSAILALRSPIKRRRTDINIGVPPSPDRPGRCL
ncbi:hypothetical protein ABL78_7556 [Leptomonas seymouri]|uniref:Uncharacterized protein n=1 Tax=Leptomonas seymouri TaxID=5684 RepID=A0A0N1HZD5_LEPSE|nr:hypothetical protein ABL78_7556 [Leptomonas seymouri]|eukprot:KPI83405.1 hypothetical protein ABL78_7556 [Leptomonas seymouri]